MASRIQPYNASAPSVWEEINLPEIVIHRGNAIEERRPQNPQPKAQISEDNLTSIFAGLLFSGGLWILIDGILTCTVIHSEQFWNVILSVASFFMMNLVTNANGRELIWFYTGSAIGAYIVLEGLYNVFRDYINNYEHTFSLAVQMQATFVLLASIVFKFGRTNSEDHIAAGEGNIVNL